MVLCSGPYAVTMTVLPVNMTLLLRPQGGGGGVNFEILRYVVELDLNYQMLLS